MRFNKLLLLAPVAVLSMSSCAIIRHRIPIENYVIEYKSNEGGAHDAKPLDADGDFNILQLSDIHMSVMDDAKTHYAFIQKTINKAKEILKEEGRNLHLIAISGDIFTFASKDTVKELAAFFEKQETPWTLTFGNHDEQGYYSIDWMTGYFTNLSKQYNSNLLFRDYPDDDVFGSSNFVIDLPLFNDTHEPRQIIMIDSNRYNYGEGYGYDYIHGDQIDWYLRAREYILKKYELKREEKDIPSSLAFFHIPVPEYADAYKDAFDKKDNSTFLQSGEYVFENGKWQDKKTVTRDVHDDTSDGAPEVNTGFYSTVQELGYTKGFFVGHAHTNTNCMDYRPYKSGTDANTVALCYGIKSTDRVYSDESMLGGQLIRYHNAPKGGEEKRNIGSEWFDLDIIYHKYTDLKEGE